VVACASYMRTPFSSEPAYQLRGMATHPAWRGERLGSRLLDHGESLLRDDPIRLRWCNARTSAIGFYVKQGWTVVSDEFDIPTAGPHRRMIRRIPDVR
jgi:ribosomal protein S18 acetylase RimI-like enzyme